MPWLGSTTLLMCSGWLMGGQVTRPHPRFFMIFGFLYVARIPVSMHFHYSAGKKKENFPLYIRITVWVGH